MPPRSLPTSVAAAALSSAATIASGLVCESRVAGSLREVAQKAVSSTEPNKLTERVLCHGETSGLLGDRERITSHHWDT